MINLEKIEVMGWEHAIRGARNPMNSWDRIDSGVNGLYADNKIMFEKYLLGPNDYKLLCKLSKAGPDHGKFMRMITVYVDITAPLYWWKEFDTYKVGTVANSCSTMHKIHEKDFKLDDFSHEHLDDISTTTFETTISALNMYRHLYMVEKDKRYWNILIQLLPSSYNQKRTIMLNYEVLRNMYNARKNHKLDEWHTFCEWIERLPYSELITGKTL